MANTAVIYSTGSNSENNHEVLAPRNSRSNQAGNSTTGNKRPPSGHQQSTNKPSLKGNVRAVDNNNIPSSKRQAVKDTNNRRQVKKIHTDGLHPNSHKKT